MSGRAVILFLVLLAAWLIAPGRRNLASNAANPGAGVTNIEPAVAAASIPSASESRQIPPAGAVTDTNWATINTTDLKKLSKPLAAGSPSTKRNFESANFSRYTDNNGIERRFNPGSLLLKFKGDADASLLEVTPGTELQALGQLQSRNDLAYVELDALMTRQFVPNDQRLTNQWHHLTIGSSNAWSISTAANAVRIAIVDTPFQMNHPDLASNTVQGWDIVNKKEITSDSVGFFHSTIGAGMAAAVVNNSEGVAGAVNAKILPLNINGYLSEMHNAILWCADNNVRVVNLSWDGAYSATLNDAAAIHREKTDGMVIMSGVNSRRFLDYPNQPFITAISMTDSTDLSRSGYGRHIDFAAPGWGIYSSTTNSFYETDSGSSYSAPLFSGVVAALMSINPSLKAAEIEFILKSSATDVGPESWDQYYGWGRISFGAAALQAATYLRIERNNGKGLVLTVPYYSSINYRFLTAEELNGQWISYDSSNLKNDDETLTLELNETALSRFFQVVGSLKE